MGKIKTYLRHLVCIPVYAYRLLCKPILPACCRFYPSCSEYALQAIQAKGIMKGMMLMIWRLMRCHPFHPGGFDPVYPDPSKRVKKRVPWRHDD